MIQFKDGVDWSGADEAVVYASRIAEQIYLRIANVPLVITSIRDGEHSPTGRHPLGKAVDWRVHTIPAGIRPMVLRELRAKLPAPFVVLHEHVGTPNEHFHCHVDYKL